MRQAGRTVLILILFLGVAAAQAPPTPDISGTWVLSLSKSKVLNPKLRSETVVIKVSGKTIEMHYTTNGNESNKSWVADGKPRTVRESDGVEQVAKAYWKKSAFVTEFSTNVKGPQSSKDNIFLARTKERWTLSADGRNLINDVEDPLGNYTCVYEKQ